MDDYSFRPIVVTPFPYFRLYDTSHVRGCHSYNRDYISHFSFHPVVPYRTYDFRSISIFIGKEEAAFRRRKLEAIGGGGSQFVLPSRDWRGISYVQ